MVFDAEYNEGDLIQFSGIMFRKIDTDLFQLEKSLTTYVKLEEGRKINSFIEGFTGITQNFLNDFGVSLEKAIEQIEDFIGFATI